MREQNIEQLFRNGLSNLEADVNPNAWANISQQLQPSVPSPSAGASTGARTWGFWNYAGLFIAGSAMVITAWIYSSETKQQAQSADNSVVLVSENTSSSQPVVLNRLNPSLIKETQAKPVGDNKISEQKVVAKNPVVENKSDTEKKETLPAENRKEVPVELSDVTASSQQPEVEQPASPSNNVASDNSDALVKENDFVLMTEQHDSNSPREQESRSDFALYIPTAFTPNGDLSNDDFKVMGLNFKEYQLVIYDGKSNEVFRSNDVEQKWDGKRKDGSLAPAGIYAVMISVKDLNNVDHPYQGQLLLKR